MVFITVCSTVTVVLCFVPVLRGCVWYVCSYVRKSVFAITGRRDMGQYEVPFSMPLFGFGMRTMLAKFHVCGIIPFPY